MLECSINLIALIDWIFESGHKYNVIIRVVQESSPLSHEASHKSQEPSHNLSPNSSHKSLGLKLESKHESQVES